MTKMYYDIHKQTPLVHLFLEAGSDRKRDNGG